MQLDIKTFLAGLVVSGLCCGAAAAQSLSPMRAEGLTPSAVKGFRLTVGNPYSQRMTFQLLPMEPGFARPAAEAEVNPPELTLAPGVRRHVILAFRIADPEKEREIGMCVVPKQIAGPVLPRVCGTYRGKRAGGGG